MMSCRKAVVENWGRAPMVLLRTPRAEGVLVAKSITKQRGHQAAEQITQKEAGGGNAWDVGILSLRKRPDEVGVV